MTRDTPIVMLPGIGGSGISHWQTIWEALDPRIVRFHPRSWDEPALEDWISSLDAAVAVSPRPPILIAHSLSCLLIAHWAQRGGRARGAFLVAAPDPNGTHFPSELAHSFASVPYSPVPFPSLLVVSEDDPYSSVEHSRQTAEAWNCGVVPVGNLGHINADSQIGEWKQGQLLFQAFCAGLASCHNA